MMTTTYAEQCARACKNELTEKGWDEHHADQVEYWMLRYWYSDDFDYTDNFRVARGWIPSEVREYDKKQKNGCCGSVDDGLSTVEGNTIRVGFNHGH